MVTRIVKIVKLTKFLHGILLQNMNVVSKTILYFINAWYFFVWIKIMCINFKSNIEVHVLKY